MKKITLILLVFALSVIHATAQMGLNFDGIDDRVTIINNAAYNVGTGNFTIEAWVKLNTVQNVSFPSIISKRDAGNVNSGFLLMVYQGKVMMQIVGINLGQGTTNILDNICHHVAVTRTGTVVNYYIDGNLDATVSSSGSINTVHNLWIGRDEPASTTTPFKGMIHEVRYWNVARTQTQIQNSRNVFLVGNETGLTGYWRMNDGSGQIVNDFTSNNNDGMLGTGSGSDSADPVFQAGCLCSAAITAGGAVTFCNGGSVVLTANPGPGLTYQWKLNGSNIAGATLQTYTASAAGNYTCVVTGVCGGNTSNTITITIYTSAPTASITAGGPTSFCSGSSVTLSANTGTGFTYQWQLNSVNIAGATNLSYTASTAGGYRCIVSNPCGGTNSNTITVTITTSPTATITPNGSVGICSGGSVLLTASSGAGYSWQWRLNGGNIAGATSQTYTANQAGNFTVVVTQGSCTATSTSVNVYVVQPLSPTITDQGWGGFCNSSAVYLETGGSGTFQWFEDSHPIPNSNNYQLPIGHNGTYSVSITNACGTYPSAPFVYSNFDQMWWIDHYNIILASGPTTICTGGGSVTLYHDNMTYYFSPFFQWYKDGVAITGATSQWYDVTTAGDYVLAVTDFLWCGQGPTVFSNWFTVTTSAGTAPTVSIAAGGPITWCGAGSVTLNSTVNTGVSYQWKKNSVNIAGATSASYTANATGTYACYVSNSCGNATSNSISVTSQTTPVASISASGSTTICQGSNALLIASTGTWTYQWKKNGTDIGGATFYYYYANSAGSYTVVTTNTCGSATSNAIVVTVITVPTVSISAAGSTTFCAGGSVTLNSTSTGTTFQWKKDAVNISGATLSSYSATSTGSYNCFVTNSCGSANSNAIAVTSNPIPSATITPGGPTTFCDGESVLLSAPVASNRTYQWLKGGVNISGATHSSYTATIAGVYKVFVTNPVTGCSKTTATGTVITVNAKPNANITPQGPTTFCAGGSVLLKANIGTGYTYKWKKDANFISGATYKNYTATTAGTYKVRVTNNNGCSRLSAGVVVTVPCKPDGSAIENEGVFDARVHPNPSPGDFTFDIDYATDATISISIYDVIGKLVYSYETQKPQFTILNSQLMAGVYTAVITNGENRKVLKIIKVSE